MNLSQYGFSSRLVPPQGSGSLRVMLLGEAPGREEDEHLTPFYPGAPAGSVLERAIRGLGLSRDQFVITNVVPFRPPNNFLEGARWEHEAINGCREYLDKAIASYQPKCVVSLGGVATRAMTGLSGDKMGVSMLTGFLLPSPFYNVPTIPCFHPSYLRRGKMSHLGVLMRILRMAIQTAAEGRLPISPPIHQPPPGYVLHTMEGDALKFEAEAKEARYVAYDIETPYSTAEDSAEEAEGTQTIKSIQFSLRPDSGIFFPWREPFIDIAKRILALSNEKLGWNNWRFDDPVLKSQGVVFNGKRHDLMWAWHHTQPDLPRGLQFASAQLGWPWPWKHLDNSDPRFYGIVDVDVLQWMVA